MRSPVGDPAWWCSSFLSLTCRSGAPRPPRPTCSSASAPAVAVLQAGHAAALPCFLSAAESSNLTAQRLGLDPSGASAISDYAADKPQWLLPRTLCHVLSPAELPTAHTKLHRLFGANQARLALALQMTLCAWGLHRLSRHMPCARGPLQGHGHGISTGQTKVEST
jgi:hypothetical protein